MQKPFTMLRFSLMSVLTGTFVLGSPISSVAEPLKAGKICTGPTTDIYYKYAGGVIEAAKETLGIDLENVSTVGSLENAKAIASDRCDMAIVQSDLYIQAGADFQATPEAKLFSANLGTVAALYPEIVHILVNRNSGITSIADLAGKKVNVGEKDSGTFLTAHKIMNYYNQLSSEPQYVYEAPASAVAKVMAGTLDATFYVAGAPIPTLENLPADANVTLIPATIPIFNVDYIVKDIPAATYPWLTSDIKSNIAVWSLLTMGPSIDRTKIGAFLDTLYAKKDSYAEKYHQKWGQFNKTDSVANIKTTPINGWDYEVFHYFAGASLPVAKPQPYFCSANRDGIYTKVVKDLIPVIKSTLNISLTEKNTAGTLENVIGLYSGECAMILNQEDIGSYAFFKDQAISGIAKEMLMAAFVRILMPLYGEDVHLVVNTNSGIESSRDLADKKVNMGEESSGTFVSAINALVFTDINIKKISSSNDSPAVALPKVISGEYDAMFVVGKAPVSYLAAADCPTDIEVPGCIAGDPTTLPIKLVPIKTPDFFVKTTLSADNYSWMKSDLQNSLQATSFFGFSPNLTLDENQIAELINAVYALKVGNNTLSPTWDETTLEQGLAKFKILPGYYSWLAAQYFANKMK